MSLAGLSRPAVLTGDIVSHDKCLLRTTQRHAWCRPPQQRSSAPRRSPRCQAGEKGDVGRLLRDALQQPAQGQNLAYLAAGNFLRGLGIDNQAEINRVLDIAMNPNSLFAATKRGRPTNPHARRLDVEADLKPLLEFLQSAGLSQEQVAKAVLAHPPLLSYSVESRLQPFFEYLTGELGLSAAETVGVVERRPSLLGVGVEGLRRMVGFLQESGSSREEIVELMATSL